MSSDLSVMKMMNTIKGVVKSQCSTPNDLIFGIITSIDPLKIDIGNNQIIGEKFLFLGQMCRPYNVTIPHTHKYSGTTENKTTGITAVAPSGTCVITDTGHKHNIKDQETDDVHKENCGTDYEKYVTIEIEPKLNIGDKVLMFAFNNHQMYYVAERIM